MPPVPPKALETTIGMLIPSACQEEVLGDMHERYKSPRQYISDALRTIPLIVLSRICRTTDLQILLIEILALYVSFVAMARILNEIPFLREQQGLLKLAIPAVSAVLALIFVDAYSRPGKRRPTVILLEVSLAVIFASLLQATLAGLDPALLVPPGILAGGGGLGVLLLATLRIFAPPGGYVRQR